LGLGNKRQNLCRGRGVAAYKKRAARWPVKLKPLVAALLKKLPLPREQHAFAYLKPKRLNLAGWRV
jgi:hypothetical protein